MQVVWVHRVQFHHSFALFFKLPTMKFKIIFVASLFGEPFCGVSRTPLNPILTMHNTDKKSGQGKRNEVAQAFDV